MSKVSQEETDSPKKRAPRKRAVRRTISDEAAPAPRRRRVVDAPPVATVSSTVRKAPSRIESLERRTGSKKTSFIVTTILLAMIGGATWLGFSDKGQINVNQKITERNQKQLDEANSGIEGNDGETRTIVVPVQNSSPSVPNGGFRGRGVGTTNTTETAPVPEEIATSTNEAGDQASTSTNSVDEVISEVDSENQDQVEAVDGGVPELAP